MPDNLPEPFDVIAVGADPDDLEIACGGTLAKLVKQGYRVGMVDLTDGEPTPHSPGPEVRLAEAKEAASILGVQLRKTLELPNRRLFDSFEARVSLAKVFRMYRPLIVMGIADKTPMASPDHWQAMQITDAGVFYSRLTKWDESFDHLPPHTVRHQIWFPLGFPLFRNASPGQFIVDISDTLSIKLKAIRAYQTQFPAKERMFTTLESYNRVLGQNSGFEAGELFYSTNMVGVRDLVHFISGRCRHRRHCRKQKDKQLRRRRSTRTHSGSTCKIAFERQGHVVCPTIARL